LAPAASKFTTKAWLERVIIYGYGSQPKKVTIEFDNNQSQQLQFTYDAKAKVVLVRKPGININKDWKIVIS
jgi:hypothetical protein